MPSSVYLRMAPWRGRCVFIVVACLDLYGFVVFFCLAVGLHHWVNILALE